MFSCWDSGKHLGRVLGFLFMSVFMISFYLPWEIGMIVLIGFMMLDIGMIYYYCDIK